MKTFRYTHMIGLLCVLAACASDSDVSSSHDSINTPANAPSQKQTSVTLEENYPGFCRLEGRVSNEIAGYNASGYAMPADSASEFGWNVRVGESQEHRLNWRYSADRAVSARVVANGRESELEFPATNNESQWREISLTIPLEEGVNDIVLQAEPNQQLPLIDSLTLTGPAVAAVHCDGSPVAEMTPNPRCEAGATFSNEVVDCGGARVGLSCERGEFQPPVITLENATVKNLRIAADGGADGIWCTQGDCTLENVVWEDICEDAATQKSTPGSTLTVIGGWAWNNGHGKIFQHNAKDTTIKVTGDFTAKGQSAKLLRACGNCVDNGGPKHLILDGVRVEGTLLEEVVAPNVNYGDLAVVRNLAIKNYKPGQPAICAEWLGYDKSENKPSKRLGEAWETTACDVRPEDVVSF